MSNSIQNKLFHFEVAPPASAWDAIDASLDKDSQSFPSKLYHYQQQPSAAVWQTINNQLDAAATKPEVKVIPLHRLRNPVRVAAAAAVLLFVVLSVTFFIGNRSSSGVASTPGAEESLLNTTIPPIPSIQPPAPKTGATAVAEQDHLAVNEQQREKKKYGAAKTRNADWQKRSVQYAPAVQLPHNTPSANELSVVPIEKPAINTKAADRYMLATSTNGQVVRLPKKAYSDFACADEPMIASNKSCKEQISTLQQQMTASMATDFTQLLDLLKNLQENR